MYVFEPYALAAKFLLFPWFFPTAKQLYFLYPKMALPHAELQASFSEALEDCAKNFVQLFRSVACYADTINILCTLVGFNVWIEFLTDQA